MLWEVFQEISKNPIGEPATIPLPSSSTISQTSISSTTHNTPSVSYTTNSHTHSHTTEHLHNTNQHPHTNHNLYHCYYPSYPPNNHAEKRQKNTCTTSVVSTTMPSTTTTSNNTSVLTIMPTSLQKDKTIHPDHYPKEKPTYTQSIHFRCLQAKATQKNPPPIHTPQNQPHNTPQHQSHSLHHKNHTQQQNINHSYTVHLQHSYAQHSHHPHHSYTHHSHHHHQNTIPNTTINTTTTPLLPSTPPPSPPPPHKQTNPIPYGSQHLSPTENLHTLKVTDHFFGIIFPTLPHLSPNVAGASSIGALEDSPIRPTTATQGSHHHLAILKTYNKYNKGKNKE